jgi:hypothetical protein
MTPYGYKATKREDGQRVRSQGMSGQSWHDIIVNRESRHVTTA